MLLACWLVCLSIIPFRCLLACMLSGLLVLLRTGLAVCWWLFLSELTRRKMDPKT